jgi:nitrite reductase/ring-hydroxylating ferredoxin subunit
MRKLLLLTVSIICVSFFSCGKANPVPSTSFSFQADINPQYSALNVAGGYVYVSGYGVAGLLIYRSQFHGIVAYDRCSTYQAEKKCAVTVDDTGLQAVDPCSGSKFSLEDGTPVKAPATQALRSYSVESNSFTIHVFN